jgi:predicted O-methyltransferase YrrM
MPDAKKVALTRWTAVERYVMDQLFERDAALDAALASSAAARLPAINLPPPHAKLLALVARAQGATRILEIGTLGGYSAIWLARALPAGGRLISLEIDPGHAAIARDNLARAGVSDVVEIRIGAALDLLPELDAAREGPFDLIFIDADKANIPEYFRWSLRLSRVGTLIVVDNVVRDGALIDEASADGAVRGVRRLHEVIAADPRVSATTIQTVGSKGYDGFLVALVTA